MNYKLRLKNSITIYFRTFLLRDYVDGVSVYWTKIIAATAIIEAELRNVSKSLQYRHAIPIFFSAALAAGCMWLNHKFYWCSTEWLCVYSVKLLSQSGLNVKIKGNDKVDCSTTNTQMFARITARTFVRSHNNHCITDDGDFRFSFSAHTIYFSFHCIDQIFTNSNMYGNCVIQQVPNILFACFIAKNQQKKMTKKQCKTHIYTSNALRVDKSNTMVCWLTFLTFTHSNDRCSNVDFWSWSFFCDKHWWLRIKGKFF